MNTGPAAKPLPRRSPPATLRAFSRQLVALVDDFTERTDDQSVAALACAVRAAAALAGAQRAAGTGLLMPVAAVPGEDGNQEGVAGLRWLPSSPPTAAQPMSAERRSRERAASKGSKPSLTASAHEREAPPASEPALTRFHLELVALVARAADNLDAVADHLAAARLCSLGDDTRRELDGLGRHLHFLTDQLGQTASLLTGIEDDGPRSSLYALRLLTHLTGAKASDRVVLEGYALDCAHRSFTTS